jgi:nickel-dependent lactate racemase
MKHQVRFGDGKIEFSLAHGAETLLPQEAQPLPDPESSVRKALDNPIGIRPFSEVIPTKGSVAIILNDETRVARTDIFLPILLDEMNRLGIEDRQIFGLISNGTHRLMTREEIQKKVSPLACRRIKVYNHNSRQSPMVRAGKTRAGTEVAYNRRFFEADRIIITGCILHHFFAGYGGGRKAIFPGVAAYDSIEQNHKMSMDPRASFGKLKGNPVDDDFQEAVAFRKPDFMLNTILDENKKIVAVAAGDYRKAHEEGCKTVDRLFGSPVPEAADLVIASCGGYPKDINLFQSHKTMENAVRITKKGGVVILLAECRDGIGPSSFVHWLRRNGSAKEMEEKLLEKFQFGGHKAFFLSRLTEKADVLLVSSIPEKSLQDLFVKPVATMPEALKMAYDKVGPKPLTYILPQGGLVFPWVKSSR